MNDKIFQQCCILQIVVTAKKPVSAFKSTAVIGGLFQDISLSDFIGQWVVLFFYPMDFTFVCPTEILAFNDALEEFKEIDTVILGASTNSQYSHFSWANSNRKEGGLACPLPETDVLLEDEGIALRGLFIIDPKGILRQITINDLPVGPSVEETLRLDKHGEVCPAGWSEGGQTIKATPTDKIEYFNSVGENFESLH
ncbi:peroxiredoxin [Gymnopus androsaceus JB14]|uniref:Peroxiredoxin n=1 Tax=Gymnopus androsaceus JB14 TaxID=1447944 RepID=A0A6A4HFA0_9AGAR|nr:peroxiredoxin [Gymnopus androsaceus JB14]